MDGAGFDAGGFAAFAAGAFAAFRAGGFSAVRAEGAIPFRTELLPFRGAVRVAFRANRPDGLVPFRATGFAVAVPFDPARRAPPAAPARLAELPVFLTPAILSSRLRPRCYNSSILRDMFGISNYKLV